MPTELKAGFSTDFMGGSLDDQLAQDAFGRSYLTGAYADYMPISDAQRRMAARGMPQGIPAWAKQRRSELETMPAPSFGSSAPLAQALAAQYAVDPTQGAMADYRYALAQRLGQSGRAPTYAELGVGARGAGQAAGQAMQSRSQGLLEALGQAGTQDTRVAASDADWGLQRSALGRRLASMGMQDKREQYNRMLDDIRARLFQGQIDMRRNLADTQARNQAAKELAAGTAGSVGTAAAMWPSEEDDTERHAFGQSYGATDEWEG